MAARPIIQLLVMVGLVSGSHPRAAELPSRIELHPDLEISLFAREPDVVDPVAVCFDAAGRLYVVEMRDFPYGLPPGNQPGGTVRLLEDTNGDGRADRSVVFADKLSFPTSIAPWRDGVIVAAPPEIVFLKDTTGDGRADTREVLVRGFRVGPTDSNASGLRWGLDNWLHGVNGGNGGELVSTRKAGAPLRLGNLDFRLRPDSGELETTYSTGGGFGLVFDEWGRSFTPHNVNHVQMRILPARLLARQPGLPPTGGTHSISDHGDMARIFAISEAQTRPNHPEQAGYFSACGGAGYLGHRDYPADLAGSVTVGDMVGNLIHRDVLRARGPILQAGRSPVESAREFIASTDIHFRPTALELGPDGALYLLDMQRDVIEHPDYIPAKMRAKLNLRAGDGRGRIYRIIPKRGVRQNQRPLAAMSPEELVAELRSPNQWRRMTAQRLLVESGAGTITASLAALAVDPADAVARVHALWTLEGLGALPESLLLRALRDEAPGVVENAIQIAVSSGTPGSAPREAVQSLAVRHPEARVRFVAAARVELSTDAVAELLRKDGLHPWSRIAALGALPGGEHLILREMILGARAPLEDWQRDNLAGLADLVGARGDPEAFRLALEALPEAPSDIIAPVIEGLRGGLTRRSTRLESVDGLARWLAAVAVRAPIEIRRQVWSLERQLGLPASPSQTAAIREAIRALTDDERGDEDREPAIRLVALAEGGIQTAALLPLFAARHSARVQRAALDVLQSAPDPVIASNLLARWTEIHPSLKRSVTHLLLGRREYHPALLDALETGRVKLGELNLDLEDRRRLIEWSTPPIRERARALIGDGEYGNRQARVEEWLGRLPPQGEPARGAVVFQNLCASCHRAGGIGHEVGPDLSGASHRSVEDLVSNILDPNMAIHPNYQTLAVETKDGELITGILAAENTEAVTLALAQGARVTVRRDQILRQSSTGASLMPEGLEAGLQPADLRDLVAFLQKPENAAGVKDQQ